MLVECLACSVVIWSDKSQRMAEKSVLVRALRDRKLFVSYANQHHDDRLAFWCGAPDGAQRMLVESGPERFFVPPYVGHRGWLGVRLDVPTDWDEIADLVTDAYREVAPKRLLAELDLRNA